MRLPCVLLQALDPPSSLTSCLQVIHANFDTHTSQASQLLQVQYIKLVKPKMYVLPLRVLDA